MSSRSMLGHGVQVNHKKSNVVVYGARNVEEVWNIGGKNLVVVEEYKYIFRIFELFEILLIKNF